MAQVFFSILFIVASVAPSDEPELKDLRRELVRNIEADRPEAVGHAAQVLSRLATVPAAEILIEDGLLCGKPEFEEIVFEALELMPEGDGFEHLCQRCMKHPRVEVRDQLVRALALRNSRSAYKAILTALYDREDGVKISAIDAIRLKDARSAIPHLIRALQHQIDQDREMGQVALSLRRLLNKWYGKQLSYPSEYEELWRNYSDRLTDPRNRRSKDPLGKIEWEKGGTSVFSSLPQFFGDEIMSQRVVFIIDCSSSMDRHDPLPEGIDRPTRSRMARVKSEFRRMIERLPDDFKFTLIAFNDEVKIYSKGLQRASEATKRKAIQFVDKLEAKGETYTDRALEAAFEVKGARTIVLLSDGNPFRSDPPIDVLGLLGWVDATNRFTHRQISTVGFSATSGDTRSFLRELSWRNHGTYSEIP